MSYSANYQIVVELEKLFDLYEYETHTRHFIRWCKGEFVPGGKKLQIENRIA